MSINLRHEGGLLLHTVFTDPSGICFPPRNILLCCVAYDAGDLMRCTEPKSDCSVQTHCPDAYFDVCQNIHKAFEVLDMIYGPIGWQESPDVANYQHKCLSCELQPEFSSLSYKAVILHGLWCPFFLFCLAFMRCADAPWLQGTRSIGAVLLDHLAG